MCPAQDHFIFLTLLIPDPDVGLAILVRDIENTSFHFGLCGRNFVLRLFGQLVSNAPGGTYHGRGINDSPSTHAKLADIQKALAHNVWSHILFVHAITGFDTISPPYNIGKTMFVLEDETERGLDYDKCNPTEGCQSQ